MNGSISQNKRNYYLNDNERVFLYYLTKYDNTVLAWVWGNTTQFLEEVLTDAFSLRVRIVYYTLKWKGLAFSTLVALFLLFKFCNSVCYSMNVFVPSKFLC